MVRKRAWGLANRRSSRLRRKGYEPLRPQLTVDEIDALLEDEALAPEPPPAPPARDLDRARGAWEEWPETAPEVAPAVVTVDDRPEPPEPPALEVVALRPERPPTAGGPEGGSTRGRPAPAEDARMSRWLPTAVFVGLVVLVLTFAWSFAERSDPLANRQPSPSPTVPAAVTSPPTTTVPEAPTTTASTVAEPPTTAVPAAPAPAPTAPPPTAARSPRTSVTAPPRPRVDRFGPACGFAPGTIVDIVVNGRPAGTQTADAGGCVTFQR